MLDASLHEKLLADPDISFTDVLSGEALPEQQKNPDVYAYALGKLGSFSSQVAYEIALMILDAQGSFASKNTSKTRGSYVEPIIEFTTTNEESIEKLNGSNIAVVPFANTLGGVVRGTMTLIKTLLDQGENINILGWYKLRVRHVLACLPDVTQEDIDQMEEIDRFNEDGSPIKVRYQEKGDIVSAHSHPQALAQCNEEFIKMGCIETSVIEVGREEGLELGKGEVFIGRSKQTRDYLDAGFTVLRRHFQDEEKADEHYTIFTKDPGMDVEDISKVYGTLEALELCAKSLGSLDKVQRIPKDSTTAHIKDLKLGEAVVCSLEAARANGLKVLDDQFCPIENDTYFAILQSAKRNSIVPGLEELIKDITICTIELESLEAEAKIREIFNDIGVEVLVEEVEEMQGQRRLFTGIINKLSHGKRAKFQRKINQLQGNVKILKVSGSNI